MYYPLSQIKTNLYTNGGELLYKSTQQQYKGYYFQTSDNKYFSGKTPDDRPNEELQLLSYPSIDNSKEILSSNNILSVEDIYSTNTKYPLNYDNTSEYSRLKGINITPQFLPYYNPMLPIEQDYSNGEFRRLFCKKSNELNYIEIDKEQFAKLTSKDNQILWQLYQPFNITWILTGEKSQVYKINKNIVELIIQQQKLYKFGEYLNFNYIKYYK